MKRRSLFAAFVAIALSAAILGPANAYPGPGVISNKNMEWMFNQPQGVGSDIEFLEMGSGASLKRYAITGDMSHGFNIYDITTPELAIPAGTFVDPGVNWQGDIQVNPKRKIVVLATQGPGATLSHMGSDGLVFVDVSNPALPTKLGQINGLGGAAHNSTIINDSYIYTTGGASVVDYSNPAAPVDKGNVPGMCGGHDITVDPNRPNIIYNACGSNTTQIFDVTNPLAPVKLSTIVDTKISIAHQADPNLDSSLLFITDERGGGLSNTSAPGGGVHVWDISGKYISTASITSPKKLGVWFAPYYGPTGSSTSGGTFGNLTAHNMTFQAERNLLSIGWYTMGSFVTNMSGPTVASGGLYDEYKGTANGGPTSWGNTQGNILLEGDEVWSTKWTRFDDSRYDTFLYTNGLTRGMDILKYNGPMPKKQARLQISPTATGGVVSGKLDRYAVWTANGFENRPLGSKTLTITAGGTSVTVTTAADGSFSATLGLAAGTHSVQASWPGDATYDVASTTRSVTV